MTQKINILLIEDDEAIREMYRIKFESEDIPLFIAKDGIEALELAHSIRPDILLLDIKLPIIGGEEVLEKLLREDWAPKMKVIVMTNISYSEAPQILKSDRIERYIVKAHHTPSQVIEVVKETMG